METTITIKTIEAKETVKGVPYWIVQSDTGKLGVWDKVIFEKLELNKPLSVEIKEANGYKNIIKIFDSVQVQKIPSIEPVKKSFNEKAMYVSYAKDLVVSGMKPDAAVATIKYFIEML